MADRRERLAHALDRRLGTVRVAVEAIYHRHNVSAILRTCEAMGVHHVHVVERRFHPSKGAARGAERWLDLHFHESPQEAIAAVHEAGFAIWVADLADPPVPPEQVPVERPVCLWFGAELVGVGPEARAAAEGVVTVPMHGLAQSLNVSVAAALVVRAVAEKARQELGDRALLPSAERQRIEAIWAAREEATRASAARARE
jgi:tRNA (guanosine-2'-O-)-methyltransferase